jgi:GNAT superfamily N-acetyltransferase
MMTCRALTVTDFSDWLPLWNSYLAFYKATVPAATTDVTFGRFTGGTEPMGGFIARDRDGRVLGIVHWILHRSCWMVGDYCYLQDLFVAPEVRGLGVGRAPIEAVYARAAESPCSRVWWLTHETNTAAMKLYDRVAERSGFVQYRKLL